jgi:hypothetical protein
VDAGGSGSAREAPQRWPSFALALAALLALLIVPPAARALVYTDPPVKLGTEPQYLGDSTGLVAVNSPRQPVGYDPPPVAEPSYVEVWDPSTALDAPTSAELQSEVETAIARTGLWRWGLAPPLLVSAAGGYFGWQIGSWIWGTFLDPSSPIGSWGIFADTWTPEPPGQAVLSDASGTAYTPSWGLLGTSSMYGPGRITDTGACEIELYGDGGRLYAPGWVPVTFCDVSGERNYVLFRELDVTKCGTIATCDGINPVAYPGANQPPLPTTDELQTSVLSELRTDGYPILNRYVNYKEQPDYWPDPRTRTQEDHRCDLSPPAYNNYGGNSDPDPYTPKISTPFPTTERPSGAPRPTFPDPYLRWGKTRWGGNYLDNWLEWGFRHIVAKHGWGPDDITATAETLAAPVRTVEQSPTWMRYIGPQYQQNGAICERRVVVRYAPVEDDPPNTPRGIVTSFAAVIGDAG